ncbi:MAG: hypothetical protein K8S27_06815 [Candidatus Omnitrophica bacterium]|nr:hypothetical protein [Candidatus Omnitrophota bacterium]
MNELLRKIDFGNEAGDDLSPEEILNFFVEQKPFIEYLNSKNKILLATAKKGVGKSALIRWIEAKVSEIDKRNPLVIRVTGSDLVRSCFKLTNTLRLPNDYIRDWMIRICAIINRRIGAQLSIALTDDQIAMVESAELDGFKNRNILSALTERLTKLLPSIQKIKEQIPNEIEILKRFSNKTVWFLVDDLDATYQRTEQENLELSTFFSACRYLSMRTNGIIFRATMRTDVWTMIRRYDESLDKFEQYVSDISWSQADFRTLLFKRIEYQMNQLGLQATTPPQHVTKTEVEEHMIDKVFEKRMLWGSTEKRTYKVIYTLSYHRPRWAIQLCKLTQKEAIEKEANLIAKSHIDTVWGEYGTKRIADLIAEHKHQCSNIEELLVGFRGAKRRMDRPTLLKWISNHITNHMSPIIEGREEKNPLDIAHFLYRLGFIVARVDDKENNEYEHYYFSDMPDFLSTRTNDDFGSVWEIHPCYREALDIKKMNKYQKNRRLAR